MSLEHGRTTDTLTVTFGEPYQLTLDLPKPRRPIPPMQQQGTCPYCHGRHHDRNLYEKCRLDHKEG